MSEDIGIYVVRLHIKGKRPSAHFLAKSIEHLCDLAEQHLSLEIDKEIVLRK